MTAQGRSWSKGPADRWPVILASVVAVAATGAFLVALLGGQSTTVVRNVIVRAPTASASATEDTQAGAVAAGQAFWASSDASGPAMTWTLAYRIDSYTPTAASLEGWGVAIDSTGTRWQTVTVTVRYSNGSWRPPANAEGIEVSVDPALDPNSPEFGASIASFHRLPGAP